MAYSARKHLRLPLLNQDGRWLMRFRGKRVEFVDRQSAVREAILEAFEHSRNGTPTQVVCIDEHLPIEIVWTSGVDPNPVPAGTAEPPDRERSLGAAQMARSAGCRRAAMVEPPGRPRRLVGPAGAPGRADREREQIPPRRRTEAGR